MTKPPPKSAMSLTEKLHISNRQTIWSAGFRMLVGLGNRPVICVRWTAECSACHEEKLCVDKFVIKFKVVFFSIFFISLENSPYFFGVSVFI